MFEDNLCTYCTMCCNGMLFSTIQITTSERDALGPIAALNSDTSGASCNMSQPCGVLGAGGMCQRYADRPQQCRSYTCDLVDEVEAGTLSEDFARQIVLQAKAFQRATITACSRATPAAYWDNSISDAPNAVEALLRAIASGTLINTKEKDEAMFQWGICVHYMRRHFQGNYCELPGAKNNSV